MNIHRFSFVDDSTISNFTLSFDLIMKPISIIYFYVIELKDTMTMPNTLSELTLVTESI